MTDCANAETWEEIRGAERRAELARRLLEEAETEVATFTMQAIERLAELEERRDQHARSLARENEEMGRLRAKLGERWR